MSLSKKAGSPSKLSPTGHNLLLQLFTFTLLFAVFTLFDG